jgi:hypothetical protein
MGAIGQVRDHLAAALAEVGVPVYPRPAGAVPPPCVLLVPREPYVDPGAAWGSRSVGLDVRLVVGDSPDATAVLDDLIDAVVTALQSAATEVGTVPAPQPDEQQAVLVVDIPTTTNWKEE